MGLETERRMADVLFVCVHNAGRSQMAKAIFNALARQRGLLLEAESAGTEPADHVHSNVVSAMRELGIDLSPERPRLLANDMVESAGRVITMGCAVDAEACPAVFIKGVEDWGLPEPKGKELEGARVIRDAIQEKVERLLTLMHSGHTHAQDR